MISFYGIIDQDGDYIYRYDNGPSKVHGNIFFKPSAVHETKEQAEHEAQRLAQFAKRIAERRLEEFGESEKNTQYWTYHNTFVPTVVKVIIIHEVV